MIVSIKKLVKKYAVCYNNDKQSKGERLYV